MCVVDPTLKTSPGYLLAPWLVSAEIHVWIQVQHGKDDVDLLSEGQCCHTLNVKEFRVTCGGTHSTPSTQELEQEDCHEFEASTGS